MKDSPCRQNGINCTKRHVGCHSTCKEYMAWKAEVDRVNANRFADKEKDVSIWNRRKR